MRGCLLLVSAVLLVFLGAMRVFFGAGYPENVWIGWAQMGTGLIGGMTVAAILGHEWGKR